MDKPCQFCGSSKRLLEEDYYPYPDATEPKKRACCNAQQRNMDYARIREEDLDDVDKF